MLIFIRTFTHLQNLYLLESYTYYNIIFKNKNGLHIIYEIYFYQKVMSLQILKNNSLFIVQENTSVYLGGIRLAQSERKEVYKKLLEQGENIKWKTLRKRR